MDNINAVIAARFIALRREGYTTQAAFDAIFGEGAYAKLASDLYDELRAGR